MARKSRKRPAWKRPGSPIGRRKKNPKYTRNKRKDWSAANVRELRELARGNTPTRVIGLKLGRTVTAIRAKAQRAGISLKPSNQSPYSRKRRL